MQDESESSPRQQQRQRREHSSSRWQALAEVHKELKQKSRFKEDSESQTEAHARTTDLLPANGHETQNSEKSASSSPQKNHTENESGKPRSAYRIFLAEQMRDWINEHPDLSHQEIIGLLAESWQKAPDLAKLKYIQQAETEQQAYSNRQQGITVPPVKSQEPTDRSEHSTTKPKVYKAVAAKSKKHASKKSNNGKVVRPQKAHVVPKGQLRQKDDGTYARPPGRPPTGYDWDATEGRWVQDWNGKLNPTADLLQTHPSHTVSSNPKNHSPSKPSHSTAMKQTTSRTQQHSDRSQQMTVQGSSRQKKATKQQHSGGSKQTEKKRGTKFSDSSKQNGSKQQTITPGLLVQPNSSFMIQRANPKQRHGFVLPKAPPRQKADGTYAQPRGRPWEGYHWDSSGGLWVRRKVYATFAENADARTGYAATAKKKTPGPKKAGEILCPKTAPTRASDGTFVRPRGNNPSGYLWESKLGVWVSTNHSTYAKKAKKGTTLQSDARKKTSNPPNTAPTYHAASPNPPLKEISFERRTSSGQRHNSTTGTQPNETAVNLHAKGGQKRGRPLNGTEEKLSEQPKKKRGRPNGSNNKPRPAFDSMAGRVSLLTGGRYTAEGNVKRLKETSSTGGLLESSVARTDAVVERYAGNDAAIPINAIESNIVRKRKPGRPKGSKNKRKPGRPKGSKNKTRVEIATSARPQSEQTNNQTRRQATVKRPKVGTIVAAPAADTLLQGEAVYQKSDSECYPTVATTSRGGIDSVPQEARDESGTTQTLSQTHRESFQSSSDRLKRSKSQTKEMQEASGALLSLATGLVNETEVGPDIESGWPQDPRNAPDDPQDDREEHYHRKRAYIGAATAAYVACGVCPGCRATKNCGTCLPCMQLLDFAGEPLFEPVCVQRICIAPVLGVEHCVDGQDGGSPKVVPQKQTFAAGKDDSAALGTLPTMLPSQNPASAVESLSDHGSLVADDMSDLKSEDDPNDAGTKKEKSGAELARKLQSVNRARVYEEEDASDDEIVA